MVTHCQNSPIHVSEAMGELMLCEKARQNRMLIHMLQLTMADKHLSLEYDSVPCSHILCMKCDGAKY